MSVTKNSISIVTEIPEDLHGVVTRFIESHPAWSQERLVSTAIGLFLLQNGARKEDYRIASASFLNGVFNR